MELNNENFKEIFSPGMWYNFIATDKWDALDAIICFLSAGIWNNEKCLLYADELDIKRLFQVFKRKGIDIAVLIKSGQFEILPASEEVQEKEEACPVFSLINNYNQAAADGCRGFRVVGNFGLNMSQRDFNEDINDVLAKYPISVANYYNIDVLGAEGLFSILERFPNTVFMCGGKIYACNSSMYSKGSDAAFVFKTLLMNMLAERQRLKRENNMFEFLNSIAGEVAYNGNLEGIFTIVLDRIMQACMADMGIISILKDSLTKSQDGIRIAKNIPEEYSSALIAEDPAIMEAVDGILGKGRFCFIDSEDNIPDNIRELMNRFHVRSLAAIPIKLHNSKIGYLALFSKRGNRSFKGQIPFLMESMKITASILYNQILLFDMYSEVAEMQRMRALGVLTSSIAHEFNNLLTPILGFAQIVEQKADNPELKMYIEMIENSAKDGAMVVKRVQEFTRRDDKASREKYCINEILSGVIQMTQPKWKNEAEVMGKRILVKCDMKSKSLVLINASEIREVITNILFNSIDAIQTEGEITVKSWDDGNNVFFSLTDNGIGMSQEVLHNILTPFFTTKKERGTGLGLPIAYRIIHDHGGTIDIKSSQGKGTEVIVGLPMTSPEGQTENDSDKAYDKFNGRVLVVDDQKAVCMTATSILKEFGFETDAETNAKKALEMYNSKEYKFVLCDLAMPEMTGIELARRIRLQDRKCPIILMTGWAGDISGEDCKYVDVLLNKPFTICTLYNAVKEAMEKIPE